MLMAGFELVELGDELVDCEGDRVLVDELGEFVVVFDGGLVGVGVVVDGLILVAEGERELLAGFGLEVVVDGKLVVVTLGNGGDPMGDFVVVVQSGANVVLYSPSSL